MLQPGISLCMIVKNEERNLARCLKSIMDGVEQIVIVDTGSSDRTLAVAAEFGAEIHVFAWINDFSAARNYSLSFARHQWILVLDADSEANFTAAELRATVAAAEKRQDATIYLWLVDTDELGQRYARYRQPLLWRNGLGIKYVNAIHEMALIQAPAGKSSLELFHYGYKGVSPEKLAEKHRRNFTILHQEYAARPEDTRVGWELAREYCAVNDFTAALPIIEQTIAQWRLQKPQKPPDASMLEIRIQALIETNRHQEALLAIEDARREQPLFPIFPLLLQRLFILDQRWPEALNTFADYKQLVYRYRNGELIEPETPVFGLFEYPEAVKAAAQSAVMTGDQALISEYFMEAYREDAGKTVDALAKIAARLDIVTLLTILLQMTAHRKTTQLKELILAIIPQAPPATIELLRRLMTELRNWPEQE